MKKGFIIGWVILAILALTILKYFFNWSIFDAAASEQGISTIRYIRELLNLIWSYLETPVLFLWHMVLWPLIDLFWQTFQAFVEWGKNNANTPIDPIRY